MKVIGVVSNKGGVSKTTTVVNLAAGLRNEGKSVLVVDTDMQRNASTWLNVQMEYAGVYEVLINNEEISKNIFPTSIAGVDLMPASPNMLAIEADLSRRRNFDHALLKSKLEVIHGEYEYVLIDTPPTIGHVPLTVLTACTHVIIPTEATGIALEGVAQMMETLDYVKEKRNPNIHLAGVLATRINRNTRHSREVLRALKKSFGKQLLKTMIRENTTLKETFTHRQSIFDYSPSSNGAKDYRMLTKEILRMERK
jgi:chromosome partitioning protein